ncbi:MAG: hypothetical protein ATN35_09670 [Epulopiscium sp. Nele67-Bin004]|nr:MAG: hypothetical protein ATN35_09670 [Epulopiscium sp. Nele67-Bin004]
MQFIIDFFNFKRYEQNYTQDQLTNGLCYQTFLSKIENGESYPDKLLVDTILSRLDVEDDYFEHYLSREEADVELLRINTLEKIVCGDMVQAKKLFAEYVSRSDQTNNINEQYCECIRLEIESISSNLQDDYKQAITKTVPNFREKPLNMMALSNVEVYLIYKYCYIANDTKLGFELLDYLQKRDELTNVKLNCFTKLVCFLAEIFIEKLEYKKLLDLCEFLIETKRKRSDLFHLTTILAIRNDIVDKFGITDKCEDMKHWYEGLLNIYEEFGINPNNDKVLLLQTVSGQNFYVLGEVIKSRRTMLSLSNPKLSDGICEVNTISLVQNKHTKMKIANATKILERLNLTSDVYSDNIKITDMKLYKMCQELTDLTQKKKFEEAVQLLEFIKSKLNLTIKVNRQYVEHKELVLNMHNPKIKQGKLSIEQYIERLKEVLEITLPIKGILKAKTHHFTKKEVILISLLIWEYSRIERFEEMQVWQDILDKYYSSEDMKKIHFIMYGFYALNKASILGNINKFNESNGLAYDLILKTSYREDYRDLAGMLYNIPWNFKQQIENTYGALREEEIQIYLKFVKFIGILAYLFEDNGILELSKSDIKQYKRG